MEDLYGIIAVWLLASGLVGWIATTKGKNGATWFLLALLISPLIMGIIIAITEPEAKGPTPSVPPNIGDELSKFAALRDSGTITQGEFETQKVRLLSLTVARPGPRPIGSACGKCGKPLSPMWKSKCNHCGATFGAFPPVLPSLT